MLTLEIEGQCHNKKRNDIIHCIWFIFQYFRILMSTAKFYNRKWKYFFFTFPRMQIASFKLDKLFFFYIHSKILFILFISFNEIIFRTTSLNYFQQFCTTFKNEFDFDFMKYLQWLVVFEKCRDTCVCSGTIYAFPDIT